MLLIIYADHPTIQQNTMFSGAILGVMSLFGYGFYFAVLMPKLSKLNEKRATIRE